jgi:hypothetical protein
MKIPAIKKLVETYSIAQLQSAENALCEEATPEITIEGDDEGEKLTHILASIFIKDKLKKKLILLIKLYESLVSELETA